MPPAASAASRVSRNTTTSTRPSRRSASGGPLTALTCTRHDPLGYDVRAELFGSGDSVVSASGRRPPSVPWNRAFPTGRPGVEGLPRALRVGLRGRVRRLRRGRPRRSLQSMHGPRRRRHRCASPRRPIDRSTNIDRCDSRRSPAEGAGRLGAGTKGGVHGGRRRPRTHAPALGPPPPGGTSGPWTLAPGITEENERHESANQDARRTRWQGDDRRGLSRPVPRRAAVRQVAAAASTARSSSAAISRSRSSRTARHRTGSGASSATASRPAPPTWA